MHKQAKANSNTATSQHEFTAEKLFSPVDGYGQLFADSNWNNPLYDLVIQHQDESNTDGVTDPKHNVSKSEPDYDVVASHSEADTPITVIANQSYEELGDFSPSKSSEHTYDTAGNIRNRLDDIGYGDTHDYRTNGPEYASISIAGPNGDVNVDDLLQPLEEEGYMEVKSGLRKFDNATYAKSTALSTASSYLAIGASKNIEDYIGEAKNLGEYMSVDNAKNLGEYVSVTDIQQIATNSSESEVTFTDVEETGVTGYMTLTSIHNHDGTRNQPHLNSEYLKISELKSENISTVISQDYPPVESKTIAQRQASTESSADLFSNAHDGGEVNASYSADGFGFGELLQENADAGYSVADYSLDYSVGYISPQDTSSETAEAILARTMASWTQ